MARPLTPEERYNRIINEAWWAQERNLRQLKSIRAVLLEAYGELSGTLLNYGGDTLTIEQVSQFRQQIQRTMETFGREYETALKAEMQAAATNAGGAIQEALLTYVGGAPVRLGMDVTSVSQRMYDAATKRVVGGLNLSQRIWQVQTGAANILERDVLTQFALGASAQTMARRVQRYLVPGKELPKGDVPSATYSNQPRDVSYNAYRLARTEINQTWHSVHNKADAELAKEGIVLGTRWVLSASHATRMLAATKGKRATDICDDWAARMPGSPILKGQPDASPERELAMLAKLEEYGIDPRGVYLPGLTPLDHPNGLCYTESVLTPREVLLEKYGFGDKGGGQAAADAGAYAEKEQRFKERKDAEAWADKRVSGWRDVSGRQQKALQRYQVEEYRDINGALRAGGKIDKDLSTVIEHIDDAISGGRLSQDTVLYRGSSANWLIDEGAPDKLVGMVVSDKGFLSTSPDDLLSRKFAAWAQDAGETPAIWEIRAPKGTNSTFMALGDAQYGAGSMESEVLLARDTRLRILKIVQEKIDYAPYGAEFMNMRGWRIVAEVIE